ncbi:metalloregulator ArsR/SmtB family transcription factor [Oligoflexus sp.]|uniref:ArsR/SmtB family transcription factor n=1 Tax=Oligoflexus sp. TaxID=1971216 RepID=UPI0032C21A3A
MSDECCKPPRKRPRGKEFSEAELGNLCKALAHPARVRLLLILIEKGECISGDLAEEFLLAQSTVSEHLRILKEAGLVQGTIDGPRRSYCVNSDILDHFKTMVDSL